MVNSPHLRKLLNVMRETISFKHDRPIVDDSFNVEVLLWEDRQQSV
jgi:hypothetical protein